MTDQTDRHDFILLGCGSSGGVPRIGNNWGLCDPNNPKNRRRRCSALVRRHGPNGSTTLVIDTGADFREQMLSAGVSTLDAVLYTHPHADHIHGIDDLRVLAISMRQRVDVYMNDHTAERAHSAFGYCFTTPPGSNYPPILTEHRIDPTQPIVVDGAGGPITVTPVVQNHGEIDSLGFRVNGIVYSSDVKDFPDQSLDLLRDIDVWVVDALRLTPHPSHFSLQDALDWIERIRPKQAVLTNMHIDLDYDTLMRTLPDNVVPGYDGMTITRPTQT
ncbi:MAG: MBL fold metallo-hydrolase [Pseudomonadota bacterium]